MRLSDGVILVDRTRTTEDWKCRRRRYWGYEWDSTGLSADKLKLELFIGTVLHDGLAAIASQHPAVDIDGIAGVAASLVRDTLGTDDGQWANEQASLVEGLLRGFHRHSWPLLMARYPRIISVEQEMIFPIGARMKFMARPDLLLEDEEGQLWYIEYKSTSSKKEQWINSWTYAAQIHSAIRAIEHTLGREVAGVIVQGLYKGYEAYGKLNSPLVYAFKRPGYAPFYKDEIAFEYTRGFYRTPTWELSGGVRECVSKMPANVLSEQFPCSPPIFVRDALVDAFFAQLQLRELEIDMATTFIATAEAPASALDVAFPQSFEACSPGWGKECEFKLLCHGSIDDPLKHGFERRVPNHALELEAYGKEV